MQQIALSESQILSMRTHAESAYPEECCGLLLGRVTAGVKTLVEVWPTENAWSAEAEENWPEQKELTERRRYAIKPEDMLRAMKTGAIALWILSVYIILTRIVPQCPQSAIGHWPGPNTLTSLCPSDKAVGKTSAVGVLTERGTFKQRKFSHRNRLRLRNN